MNTNVINNYVKLRLSLFYLPLFLILVIVCFLYHQNSLHTESYIELQKDFFFFLNLKLSRYSALQYNLTQLGNALITFSFLSIFILHAPKMWECLASGSIISLLLCNVLKSFFAVPRPAAFFENDTFIIIGKKVCGNNSLPSGHSITVFTTLAVILFAFMPAKLKHKILWCSFLLITGLVLIVTRVAVGAHYPIDVIAGGIIGYISGLLGIFISRKYNIWFWINNKKYYPVFILAFSICCFVLISKIVEENLIIYYLSLISLIITLYEITAVYFKK